MAIVIRAVTVNTQKKANSVIQNTTKKGGCLSSSVFRGFQVICSPHVKIVTITQAAPIISAAEIKLFDMFSHTDDPYPSFQEYPHK